MAWTTPRTWTTGEIVTAALLNAQIKANMDLTAPAIMTTLGDIIYCSAANTPSRLAKSTSSTRVLTNTGTSNVPAWAQVTLTSGVTGTLPVGNGGTGITSLGSNVATFLGTPSSANLRSALTDETGTGSAVFATSPTLVTPALGTPGSGVLTSCTGLPEAGLAISNSPTNGYMLTAQSGDAGGMTWAAAGSGLSAASEAEMEAASSNTVAATPGRTQNHPGVAKTWIVIPTDAASIVDSYNTASLTDSGTGERIWIFATDFAANTFAAVTGNYYDSNDSYNFGYRSQAVGQVLLSIRNTGTNSLVDVATANVAFGEQ